MRLSLRARVPSPKLIRGAGPCRVGGTPTAPDASGPASSSPMHRSACAERPDGGQLATARTETARAQLAADWEHADLESSLHQPPSPLHGYRVTQISITVASPATGQRLGDVPWPKGSTPVSILRGGRLWAADPRHHPAHR